MRTLLVLCLALGLPSLVLSSGCVESSAGASRPEEHAARESSPASFGDGGAVVDDTACKASGGKCVFVTACNKGKGSLVGVACGRPSIVCCASCGTEDFSCCEAGATYRPICKDKKLQCKPGQTRC